MMAKISLLPGGRTFMSTSRKTDGFIVDAMFEEQLERINAVFGSVPYNRSSRVGEDCPNVSRVEVGLSELKEAHGEERFGKDLG